MPVRTRVIVALCCLALGTPAAAQDLAGVSVTPIGVADSIARLEGSADGRRAANRAVVAPRALIGFVIGIPMSVFVPVGATGNPMALAGAGLGVASIVATGRVGSTRPPVELMNQTVDRGAVYEQALRESYA